jgi:hypothetical protein
VFQTPNAEELVVMICFMCHTEHDEDEACPQVPPPVSRGTSRAFPAKYAGRCQACQGSIEMGDSIVFNDDAICHEDCS